LRSDQREREGEIARGSREERPCGGVKGREIGSVEGMKRKGAKKQRERGKALAIPVEFVKATGGKICWIPPQPISERRSW
jgi:hypothetical protein